jgi:hypothetical protein
MPSTRGVTRLDTWLSKLLWLLAQANGGEIRISSTDLEDAPDKCTIVTDWDKDKHELIIRANSGLSEVIVVNTEQQWARSTTTEHLQPSPASSPQPARDSPRSAVLGDEDLARIEQNLLKRAAERTHQRQSREQREAERRVFQE